MRLHRIFCAVILLCACSGIAGAEITGLGIMGDSLSDNYADYSYNYAKNWVQQLNDYRSVNVGDLDTWAYPRNYDYEYNWARAGATSGTLLSEGQHTGLAQQVDDGDVSHAILFIGHNDFQYSWSAYDNIYNGQWTPQQINDYVDSIVTNVTTALDTVLAEDAMVVLSTFADYAVCPAAKNYRPDAEKRDLVSAVMDQVNDGIRALAQSREVVLVDMHYLADDIFGTNQDPNDSLTVRGYEIDLDTYGTASSNAYVHDGIHTHTVIQGLAANLFMEGLNEYDAGLTPFTEAELLSHAGLTGTGQDTLTIDVGDYVVNYTPEPATMCLLLPGLMLLHSRRKAK